MPKYTSVLYHNKQNLCVKYRNKNIENKVIQWTINAILVYYEMKNRITVFQMTIQYIN